MKTNQTKSKLYIILIFLAVIIYLIVRLWNSFKYIDLGYLLVLVVSLIRFLRVNDFN